MPLTLGSLFDGIGGFPLAAVYNGIVPLWASEIEKFPMDVTRERFPAMTHVGDITKLKGKDLPPVDIVTGGSPCQDLSVAGARAGLEGERSGLFMEQIRVIKEMRDADRKRGRTAEFVRPRFMVWENVPGAFSSAEGEDFRTVLEETLRISDSTCHVPRPPTGSWKSAGAVLGNGFSLAWRVIDAQFWGVPQRRSRIFLVADFSGESAPQILFEQDRLPGYPAEGKSEGEAPAFGTGDSAGDTGGYQVAFAINQRDAVGNLFSKAGALADQPGIKQQTFVAAFNAGAGDQAGGIGYSESRSPTIKGSAAGNMMPSVLYLNDQGGSVMECSEDVVGTLHAQEHGHQPLVLASQQGGAEIGVGICPTITAAVGMSGNNQPVLFENHGDRQMFLYDNHSQDGRYNGPIPVAPTVSASYGEGGNNVPLVQGGKPALFENHGIDARYTGPHEVAPTISARCGTGGNNLPLVRQEPEVFCITGNAIDCKPQNGGNGLGFQRNLSYTLMATDHHAVYSRQRVDEFRVNLVASTESARQGKDATDLVYQKTVRALTSSDRKGPNAQYVGQDKLVVEGPKLIRRMTPLECERLQGFPDGWTALPGASDSARYKALGNSVAIPCVFFVLRGIALVLRQDMERRA